jgi:chromosome segregation ATPase
VAGAGGCDVDEEWRMAHGVGSDLPMTGAVADPLDGRDPGGRAAAIAHREGQIEMLRAQVAGLEAADEHHRAELAAAQAEAADAQAGVREAWARLEERQHLVESLRERLDAAQAAQSRAEQERTLVIESLGRRAKRRLGGAS